MLLFTSILSIRFLCPMTILCIRESGVFIILVQYCNARSLQMTAKGNLPNSPNTTASDVV